MLSRLLIILIIPFVGSTQNVVPIVGIGGSFSFYNMQLGDGEWASKNGSIDAGVVFFDQLKLNSSILLVGNNRYAPSEGNNLSLINKYTIGGRMFDSKKTFSPGLEFDFGFGVYSNRKDDQINKNYTLLDTNKLNYVSFGTFKKINSYFKISPGMNVIYKNIQIIYGPALNFMRIKRIDDVTNLTVVDRMVGVGMEISFYYRFKKSE